MHVVGNTHGQQQIVHESSDKVAKIYTRIGRFVKSEGYVSRKFELELAVGEFRVAAFVKRYSERNVVFTLGFARNHFAVVPVGFSQVCEFVQFQPESYGIRKVRAEFQSIDGVVLIEVQFDAQIVAELPAVVYRQSETCQKFAQFRRIEYQINVEIVRNGVAVLVQFQVAVRVDDVFAPAGEFEVVDYRAEQRHNVDPAALFAFFGVGGSVGCSRRGSDVIGIQIRLQHIQEDPVQHRIDVKSGNLDIGQDLIARAAVAGGPQILEVQIQSVVAQIYSDKRRGVIRNRDFRFGVGSVEKVQRHVGVDVEFVS